MSAPLLVMRPRPIRPSWSDRLKLYALMRSNLRRARANLALAEQRLDHERDELLNALAAEDRGRTCGRVKQNNDGQVVEVNDAALELLALTRDQLMGLTSLDPRWVCIRENGTPCRGEDHPAVVTLRTGHNTSGRVGVGRPDGSLVWLEVEAQRVPDGVVVIFWRM